MQIFRLKLHSDLTGYSLQSRKRSFFGFTCSHSSGSQSGGWLALVLCLAVLGAGILEQFFPNRPDYAKTFAPKWIPFAAAIIAAVSIKRLNCHPQWVRLFRVLCWCGLLLMVWAANGLPLDLLHMTGLMPPGIDWPGLATRMFALAATIVLVRPNLSYPSAPIKTHSATWYGYTAFVLALPYPVFRTLWALGGKLGLMFPGAAGHGFIPWLASIPWLMAAVLSLFLVSSSRWMPRRMLLAAGWSATAIVAMVGPSACWSVATNLVTGGGPAINGIASWVPCLFYSSWLLWAIAAGAATRSYQLRSGNSRMFINLNTKIL